MRSRLRAQTPWPSYPGAGGAPRSAECQLPGVAANSRSRPGASAGDRRLKGASIGQVKQAGTLQSIYCFSASKLEGEGLHHSLLMVVPEILSHSPLLA